MKSQEYFLFTKESLYKNKIQDYKKKYQAIEMSCIQNYV